MKIMAVLAVLLAAALFIGAASAAAATVTLTTENASGETSAFTVNMPITIKAKVTADNASIFVGDNFTITYDKKTLTHEFTATPALNEVFTVGSFVAVDGVTTFTTKGNPESNITLSGPSAITVAEPTGSKVIAATEVPSDYSQGIGQGTFIATSDGTTPLADTTFYNMNVEDSNFSTDVNGQFTIDAEDYNGIYTTNPLYKADSYYYISVAGAQPVPEYPMNIAIAPTSIEAGESVDVTLTLNEAKPTGATLTVDYGDGTIMEYTDFVQGISKTYTHKYTKTGTYEVTYSYTGTTEVDDKVLGTISVSESVAEIGNHGAAFVYQTIKLNQTDFSGVKTLYFYSSDATPTLIATLKAEANDNFNLLEAAVNGHYGAWYTEANPASNNYITIWYPDIALKAELTTGLNGATSGDSIDGKTINKNTEVSFLIEAPNVGPADIAAVKIVFTTPASGKTTLFGGEDFTSINLNKVQTLAGYTFAGNDATAGTWTAQAEFTSPKGFSDNAKKTNTISFTLQSTTLTITAAKDSVVRSNPFTVSIQGDSKTDYAVYLETPSSSEINPTLQGAQNGFQSGYNTVPATGYIISGGLISYDGALNIGGTFKTDASGKRTIQFNTNKTTEDKTYTVKVSALKEDTVITSPTYGEIIFDSSNYDKVKVKVEKGAVTIAASGDGSYYIGDEIKLTGTNTDSTEVFLFITGQNLAQNGILVKALPDKVAAKDNSQPVSVKTDNTWEYKWDTSKIALDTGAYTIYATSRLTNGKSSDPGLITDTAAQKYGTYMTVGGSDGYYAVKLSDSEYATVSINLKQPFLSAVPSGTIVAKGDKIYIRGTAEGNPSALNIFIFGPNFFEPYSVSVEDDGTYEKKIEIPSTMSSNQYFVVVQHPMYNDVFDAELVAVDGAGAVQAGVTWPNENYQWAFKTVGTTTGGDAQSFIVWGSANKLQGSQAADALTKMIDSANIDDIYTKLTFTVAEPWIKITNPGDKALGSKFTISGTTNLAIDDQILVEVMSSSFSAIEKTSTSTTSGVSQATKVVAGEGADNTWSVDVDTTNWKLDEYTIKVNGIEVDVTTTTNFNLVEKPVTTTPTTAVPTGATPTATTAKPTETPKTPGFGAFIALAGLGAVALLVLRRN
ncbi:MAG TPA: MEMAR_RS02690 family S-layer glycoprotein [Methanocorpusculum sp.]|nr:MEMAR_RS02690 family S-layer glycoprotein [Methanocorpusculum sp.]HJK79708.1 MEMAR_RS02690 family S-layer glycoprotein [Methanocorpusculum sp.]